MAIAVFIALIRLSRKPFFLNPHLVRFRCGEARKSRPNPPRSRPDVLFYPNVGPPAAIGCFNLEKAGLDLQERVTVDRSRWHSTSGVTNILVEKTVSLDSPFSGDLGKQFVLIGHFGVETPIPIENIVTALDRIRITPLSYQCLRCTDTGSQQTKTESKEHFHSWQRWRA